jgi:hypothetical protein
MARSRSMIVMLCVLALSGASYFSATSPVDARHAKHRSLKKAAKKTKEKKDKEATKEAPTPRTPADKQECISVSQAYYGRAKSAWRGTKHGIPNEFVRVISDLDQFCGEEEFEKARVTMDWMSTCLQNSNKDDQPGSCSRSKSYFCALDQQSEACVQVQSEAR